MKDPIFGCVGAISVLQHENSCLQKQLSFWQHKASEMESQLQEARSELMLEQQSRRQTHGMDFDLELLNSFRGTIRSPEKSSIENSAFPNLS